MGSTTGDAGAFDEAAEALQAHLRTSAWVHPELRPTLQDAVARTARRLDPSRVATLEALLRTDADRVAVDVDDLDAATELQR